jgi:hypothetical protein
MAIQRRSSVLAIMQETTEGTPVAPAASTDYIAMQDDFSIEPGTDVLENAEQRNSIAAAKPIIGAENPKVSLSHYVRHSGVEGTAPNYRNLLIATFGQETVQATERATGAASTALLVKAATGTGTDWERGELMLVKDPVNGYSVRAVYSKSTDDLVPLFQLPGAPASGVNLGKCVLYKPVNSGHTPLTFWHYLGNGGALELMTGGRVTEMSVDFSAGDLVNASYSVDGLRYCFNPVIVTASKRYIDWADDDGTHAAAVTAGTYSDPTDYAAAVQAAMRAASTQTPTVTYNSTTGKYKITSTGTLLTLKWNTGTNTANTAATLLGFSAGADNSGTAAATGYNSATAYSAAAPQSASYDNADPIVAKDNEIMIGDQTNYLSFDAASVSFKLSNSRAVKPSCAAQRKT